jgi:DNA polymerase I-like protein with 3'-5' exonuclease and polymerase domains/5'-3' exonuclease
MDQSDIYIILDLRGLVLHSYHSGTDPDAPAKNVHTPGYTLNNFIDRYLLPITKLAPLNHIIAVNDAGSIYRTNLNAEYKANRKKVQQDPEVKIAQDVAKQAIRNLLHSLGIPQCHVPGTEADDVIAYLAQKLPGQKLIYTVDGDLVALASPNTAVFLKGEPATQYAYKYDKTVDGVKQKRTIMVAPQYVTLFKSIVGDSSDNIPGVKGMGPAIWDTMIDEFGYDGLDELISLVESEDFGKLRRIADSQKHPILLKLAENMSQWRNSYLLAKLRPELVNARQGDSFTRIKWEKRLPSAERLRKLEESANAPWLTMTLGHLLPKQYLITAQDWDDTVIPEAKRLFNESRFISLDWETWAPEHEPFKLAGKGKYVDMLSSKITGAGIACGENLEHNFYFQFEHADEENNIPKNHLLEIIDAIPADKPIVAQNCLPGDVEVLTPQGWKDLRTITVSDQVMQWDPRSGQLSFTEPSAKIETTSSVLLSWEGASHSCSYTPEHRMYCREWGEGDWVVKTADKVSQYHPNGLCLPTSGEYKATSIFSVTEVRLIEAVRADGSFSKSGVRFTFKKQRKIDRLLGLIRDLDLQYSSNEATSRHGETVIRIHACALVSRIIEFLGENKGYTIPGVLQLSANEYKAIIDEAQHWDGFETSASSCEVNTIDKETADAFQVMAHAAGYRCTVKWRKNTKGLGHAAAKDIARVRITRKSKTRIGNRPTTIHGDFDVFCVSVPTGAFLIRSKGVILVTGNCVFERSVLLAELNKDLPNLRDTKIMHSHVDESLPSGLKEMSKIYLNYNQTKYDEVVASGMTMRDYTGSHVFSYGVDDVKCTGHLYDLFRIILILEGTWDFVRENEFAAIYQLSDAFLAGVEIDYDEVERQREEDQLTFDTNMLKIRELLDANVNEDTIVEGATNWMNEELIPFEVAEAKYVIKLLTDTVKKPNAVDLIKRDKLLNEWVGESAATGITLDEYKLTVEEEVLTRTRFARGNDKNVTMWDKALAAATYKPFRTWQKPATFQFSLGKLNQLAEFFGLPNWPADITGEDAELRAAASRAYEVILPEDMTTRQMHYVNMVLETAMTPKAKRSKSEAYKFLKETYVENFEGSWEKEGTELSLDSPKQMQELLYAMLGLPIRIRAFEPSKGRAVMSLDGAAQTNKDAIATAIAFGDATGWRKEVLELMTTAKAALTRIKFFYTKFPLWRHPIDGLIHPQFNSTGTETRRPSGSSPNLLQLSKKGEGVKVRRCIVPNSKLGHDLVGSIDWRAQELRVLASLSQDPTMVACYIGDNLLDLHSVTAAYMMGLGYEEFMTQMTGNDPKLAKLAADVRKSAKNVNFGSVYGIGGAKLARQLLVSPEEAKAFLDAKKAAYPGVEEWKADVKASLHATGIVKTQFGTIKHIYDKLLSKDEGLVGYYERAAVNQTIQGVCADYLKKVLRDLWVMRTFQRHGASLIAPIYDEVVFSFHHSVAVPLYMELCNTMRQGIPGLMIPMTVAPALGLNFGDQIEILADDDNDLTEEKILKAIDKAFGRNDQKEAA